MVSRRLLCVSVAALWTLAPSARAGATVYSGCVSVVNTSGADAVVRLDAYPGWTWTYPSSDTNVHFLKTKDEIVKLTADMAKLLPVHVEPSNRLTLLDNFFTGGADPNCPDFWRFVIATRPELLGH